jgi:mannose-6-phosphate isomerase-like protein (cupin superfamily)
MKKKLVGGTAVLAGLAIFAITTAAVATPNLNFSTVQISKGLFGEIDVKAKEDSSNQVKLKTKGDSDVYVVENTVQPGGHSGWHYHPGPSLITVKSGTATFYDGDDPTCTGHDFEAGTGVVDDSVDADHVHLLRNNGTVPLVTVTFQIVPAGAPRRIDAPDPGNCVS